MKRFAGINVEDIKTATVEELTEMRKSLLSAYISRLAEPDAIYGETPAAEEVRKNFDRRDFSKPINNYLYLTQARVGFSRATFIPYLLSRLKENMPISFIDNANIATKLSSVNQQTDIKELYNLFLTQNLQDAQEALDQITKISATTLHSENLVYAISLQIFYCSVILQSRSYRAYQQYKVSFKKCSR